MQTLKWDLSGEMQSLLKGNDCVAEKEEGPVKAGQAISLLCRCGTQVKETGKGGGRHAG